MTRFEPKPMNILIYDDKDIKYYDGVITSIDMEGDIDTGHYITGEAYAYVRSYNLNITVPSLGEHDNVKLDDTLMKRIAKFNKEEECERLNELIEEKKEKIKELDDLLMDKEKRWNKVKEYIKNIYEIDTDEDWDDWDDDEE